MYTLISGSPKITNSNSLHFLNIVSSNLEDYNIFELKENKIEDIITSIDESSVIVFSFPLYVDSPPSIALSLLDYIIDNNIDLSGKIVYVIINCGFREGEHNKTAVKIIKNWCHKTGAIYGSSIMIGAGEIVGKEKYKLISQNALKSVKEFANVIKERKIKDDIITTMDIFNNKLYCHIANLSWTKKGKKNNLSKKEIKEK